MSGLRERNKLERRHRIVRATVELLAEKGFEGTTTREIAARAGVAAGTIFLYAHNKLDLFLMSITDDLDPLTESAFRDLDPAQPVVDQLCAFFRPRYVFWARFPELSRVATREMAASHSPGQAGGELERGIRRRTHTLARLREILQRAAEAGRLRRDVDLDAIARVLLYVYLSELRFWLGADAPQPDDAVAKFRGLAEAVLIGLTTPSGRSA